MSTTDRRIFWMALAFGLLSGAYAVAKVIGYGLPSFAAVPAAAWAFLAGMFIRGRASHEFGRAHQRIAHGYIVWKTHPR